jgi:Protein of unknown function (DUF4240)
MDRAQFWAMVQAARTTSRQHIAHHLELAATRLAEPPDSDPEIDGHRWLQLLADRLADLPLADVVGAECGQVEGRLGNMRLTEAIGLRQHDLLVAQLCGLPWSEVVGFQRILEELEAESFRVDLWAAALVIHRMGPVDDFWAHRLEY